MLILGSPTSSLLSSVTARSECSHSRPSCAGPGLSAVQRPVKGEHTAANACYSHDRLESEPLAVVEGKPGYSECVRLEFENFKELEVSIVRTTGFSAPSIQLFCLTDATFIDEAPSPKTNPHICKWPYCLPRSGSPHR